MAQARHGILRHARTSDAWADSNSSGEARARSRRRLRTERRTASLLADSSWLLAIRCKPTGQIAIESEERRWVRLYAMRSVPLQAAISYQRAAISYRRGSYQCSPPLY